jgi:hypothetical protein
MVEPAETQVDADGVFAPRGVGCNERLRYLSLALVNWFQNAARIAPLVSVLLDPSHSPRLFLERTKELKGGCAF